MSIRESSGLFNQLPIEIKESLEKVTTKLIPSSDLTDKELLNLLGRILETIGFKFRGKYGFVSLVEICELLSDFCAEVDKCEMNGNFSSLSLSSNLVQEWFIESLVVEYHQMASVLKRFGISDKPPFPQGRTGKPFNAELLEPLAKWKPRY